jgi:hypothetical protein
MRTFNDSFFSNYCDNINHNKYSTYIERINVVARLRSFLIQLGTLKIVVLNVIFMAVQLNECYKKKLLWVK